jgi:hypothetical protein
MPIFSLPIVRRNLEQLVQYQQARIVGLERKVKEQMVEINSLILDLGELQTVEQ